MLTDTCAWWSWSLSGHGFWERYECNFWAFTNRKTDFTLFSHSDKVNILYNTILPNSFTWVSFNFNINHNYFRSVKDLARLNLKSPVYVSVHENSQYSTPEALQQSYVVCRLESKLNMLWSFLKHHRKSKILVFMSSCKQVCVLKISLIVLMFYPILMFMKCFTISI